MKFLNMFLLAGFMTALLASCYEEKDWLGENAEFTGRGFPAIFMNPLDSAIFSKGGRPVRVYLEFWSDDPMQEIRLYNTIGTGTRTLVSTTPYAPAFSRWKRADTLILGYTIPATAAANTSIRLDAEVLNQNGLTKGTFSVPTSPRTFRVR